MKFLLQIPFTVHQGARVDGCYTAEVRDREGRTVPGTNARHLQSQELADARAVEHAKKWAADVRVHHGFKYGRRT